MNLTREAAALVIAAGAATVDDLMPKLEGFTRQQVMRALKAATDAGLIESDGWTGPRPGGSTPATYRAIRPRRSRPAASVWELARAPA